MGVFLLKSVKILGNACLYESAVVLLKIIKNKTMDVTIKISSEDLYSILMAAREQGNVHDELFHVCQLNCGITVCEQVLIELEEDREAGEEYSREIRDTLEDMGHYSKLG